MPNANRDKGLKSERDAAAYFRAAGINNAWRSVATGHVALADSGDLKHMPGFCVQIKNVDKTGPLTGQRLANALKETAEQTMASGQIIGLLIEKRRQCADVGKWYAWLAAEDHVALVTSVSPAVAHLMVGPAYPVRVELRYIIDKIVLFSELARDAGYR